MAVDDVRAKVRAVLDGAVTDDHLDHYVDAVLAIVEPIVRERDVLRAALRVWRRTGRGRAEAADKGRSRVSVEA